MGREELRILPTFQNMPGFLAGAQVLHGTPLSTVNSLLPAGHSGSGVIPSLTDTAPHVRPTSLLAHF